MKEKIIKKIFEIIYLIIVLGFILTFIVIIKPTIFKGKIPNIIILANDVLLVMLLAILYIAYKNEINLLTKEERKNAVILSIFASILYSVPALFNSTFDLEFGTNIILLFANRYTIIAILLYCFTRVDDKKKAKKDVTNLKKKKTEKEIIEIKKSNKKYKIMSIIGLAPITIILIYSVIEAINGSTFLWATTYGLKGFFQSFLFSVALAYPIVLLGLFISIYSLMKIKKY